MLKKYLKIALLSMSCIFIITGCSNKEDVEKNNSSEIIEENFNSENYIDIEDVPILGVNDTYSDMNFKDGKEFVQNVDDSLLNSYVDIENKSSLIISKSTSEENLYYFDLLDKNNAIYEKVGIDDEYIYLWTSNNYIPYKYENNSLTFEINDINYFFVVDGNNEVNSYRNAYFEEIDKEQEISDVVEIDTNIDGYWYNEDNFVGYVFNSGSMEIDDLNNTYQDTYYTNDNFIYTNSGLTYIYSFEGGNLSLRNLNNGVELIFEKMNEETYRNKIDNIAQSLLEEVEEIVEESSQE